MKTNYFVGVIVVTACVLRLAPGIKIGEYADVLYGWQGQLMLILATFFLVLYFSAVSSLMLRKFDVQKLVNIAIDKNKFNAQRARIERGKLMEADKPHDWGLILFLGFSSVVFAIFSHAAINYFVPQLASEKILRSSVIINWWVMIPLLVIAVPIVESAIFSLLIYIMIKIQIYNKITVSLLVLAVILIHGKVIGWENAIPVAYFFFFSSFCFLQNAGILTYCINLSVTHLLYNCGVIGFALMTDFIGINIFPNHRYFF